MDGHRIALWARGNLSLCLDIAPPDSSGGTIWMENAREDAFQFCCQFANKSTMSKKKWTQVAPQRLAHFADGIFEAALVAATICASPSSSSSSTAIPSIPSDAVPVPFLCTAIALLGRSKGANLVEYIRQNAALFCSIFILPSVDSSSLLAPNTNQNWEEFLKASGEQRIPEKALAGLDRLFEGTLLREQTNNIDEEEEDGDANRPTPYASVKPLSKLLKKWAKNCQTPLPSSFADLAVLFRHSLQADLFQLDQETTSSGRPRSLTAVTCARRRRLQLRAWKRMELLTSPTLRNGNLRLTQAQCNGSPLFHPLALESAIISNCESAGPFVLGPVRGLLLARNVQNAAISAICAHIRLHNCHNVTLFCQSERPILLVGKCRNIRLAPYNAFYDGLIYELAYAGLHLNYAEQKPTLEPKAIHFGKNNTLDEDTVCSALEEEEFYMQPTPFPITSSTFNKLFRPSIPVHYLESWQQRQRLARDRAERLSETQLTEMCPLKRRDLHYLMRKVKRD